MSSIPPAEWLRLAAAAVMTPEILRSGLNAAADRIEALEAALRQIASCEKRADGDVVDIARKALK